MLRTPKQGVRIMYVKLIRSKNMRLRLFISSIWGRMIIAVYIYLVNYKSIYILEETR